MFFSRSMLASICNRFSEARDVKNSNFAYTGAQFSQKSSEKTWILASFLEAKIEKN